MPKRESPDLVPNLRKSGLVPAALFFVVALVFLGGTMHSSRADPPPMSSSTFHEPTEILSAGCTFDVDLPLAPEPETTSDTTWVDCEPLLPPIALWTPLRERNR